MEHCEALSKQTSKQANKQTSKQANKQIALKDGYL
jgi:hypothetical protein